MVKTSNPPSEPVAALPELPLPDSDNDQVTDAIDECPDTQPRLIVEKTGCAVYDGIVSGVNFEHDSSTLTLNAKRVLDGVVETFNQHPDGEMTVHAHTDNTGSELYNQGLSERRARSVADYLIAKGISSGRFSTRGFGELSPIDTNSTPEGRANNRRVELFAYKPES